MIKVRACSINLLKELREDLEPNFCQSCAMDLVTCDCVNPRPVRVVRHAILPKDGTP